ncbi:MAG: hypothetical protein IKK59_01060 [Lachnospiraceae bacterium]|nr:hypothetical protein [Lachnospiraceae bacterium]
MSLELLQTLSLVSYILAGVFLLVAIALFFLLDVRKLIGDISGANARKAIENIRQQNESSGDKAYKPSPVNMARGKLTEKISQSGRLQPRLSGMGGSPGTQKFATTDLMPSVGSGNETTVLTGELSGATTVLTGELAGETTVLTSELAGETTVLTSELANQTIIPSMASEPTVPHSQDDTKGASQSVENHGGFSIDVEMGFLGSSEVIE